MNLDDYRAFSEQLRVSLESDARVIGLVFLGSTAEARHQPDDWSDHDFFVITKAGEQAHFREDLSWLPDSDDMAFGYLETSHGLKVVYKNGHVLEFAVFDLDEFQRYARVNEARVVLDRANIADIIVEKQGAPADKLRDDEYYWGQFIAHAMIGAGRCKRGEVLSAHAFIKHYMLSDILPLLVKYAPTEKADVSDNLDVMRRFEFVYPALGAEINAILLLEPIESARQMIALVERTLQDRMPDFPHDAFAVGKRYLDRL